jgi:hypothetical protein
VAGGLWHLNIDDLFGPIGAQTRLGGPGPFVINLSASSAPINIPATPLAGCPLAHVYQIQRYEDGRVRYRLRLGAFHREEDMDPILEQVRESYPSALTATAAPDDLFALETLRAKAEGRRRPVALQARTVATDTVASSQAPEAPPAVAAVAAAAAPQISAQDLPPEDSNSVTQLVDPIALLTEQLKELQPIAQAPEAPTPIPTLEHAVPASAASVPTAAREAAAPASVTATPATSIAIAGQAAATQEPEREEAFVLELVQDTPIVTLDAKATAPVPTPAPDPRSLDNDAAPFIAVAARKAFTSAARTEAESIDEPAALRPAPPAAKLPLFANFVRQALRRMPLSRAAGADSTSAKTPSAAPKGRSPAAAAKPVTAGSASAAMPVAAAKPAKPTLEKIKVAVNPAPAPEIASTRTVRALTQQELADQSALRWFVVELATAQSAFLPESIPQLDIYSAYRLYTVNTVDQGREVHSLRLGFFGDEIAAKTVAGFVTEYYEKPVVKRISIAERRRFEEHGVEARKDVGATGKYAVIEITDELVVRENRLQGLSY